MLYFEQIATFFYCCISWRLDHNLLADVPTCHQTPQVDDGQSSDPIFAGKSRLFVEFELD